MKPFHFYIVILFALTACKNNQVEENAINDAIAENAEIVTSKKIQNPQIKFLSEKIAKDSLNADLYFTRAKANENLRNMDLALLDYKKAIAINPKEASYYLNLNQFYLSQKNIVDAINTLSKAMEKIPKDERIGIELAKNYLYLGDPTKAVKATNVILKNDANNSEAYFYKAVAYSEMGDNKKAISTYQTAIEQNPDFYDALINLGVLMSKENKDLAESYIKSAIRVKPESDEAHYALGMFYQNRKQYEKAKTTYRNIIDYNSNYINAYYNIGYIYFQQDSLKESLQHFELTTKISPTFYKGYYMQGLVNESFENIDAAKKHYNRTLGLNPKFDLAKKALERLKEKN